MDVRNVLMVRVCMWQEAGLKPDLVSYNSLINTCAKAAGVRMARCPCSTLPLEYLLAPPLRARLDALCAHSLPHPHPGTTGHIGHDSCSSNDESAEPSAAPCTLLFLPRAPPHPALPSPHGAQVWGSVGVSQASRIIEMMRAAGVKPDITSFNCLLNAYAQAAGAGQLYQVRRWLTQNWPAMYDC